jgi:hypothetical protein
VPKSQESFLLETRIDIMSFQQSLETINKSRNLSSNQSNQSLEERLPLKITPKHLEVCHWGPLYNASKVAHQSYKQQQTKYKKKKKQEKLQFIYLVNIFTSTILHPLHHHPLLQLPSLFTWSF